MKWYAVQVKSKFLGGASLGLQHKGYEHFVPMYRSHRLWSDRIKDVELPLFPGYFFCRLGLEDRFLPILQTPGVIRIVGAGKTPLAVPDDEIRAIQRVIQSGLSVEPWPFLSIGDKVYVESGPLADMEGIVANVEKRHRLIVSVSLLRRSVAVEIDRARVRPITTNTTNLACSA
jgi:transcription antitermination factor NusG